METHGLSPKPVASTGRRARKKLLAPGVSRERTLALEGCLHELFERQVDLAPSATALVAGERTYTYAELDAKANQLARLLRFHEVGPGKLVAIYFDRSELPIIAILGCLKAGAAYVPIDPVHPVDRIRHMLEESEAALLLTEGSLAEKARSFHGGAQLVLDALGDEWHKQPAWRFGPDEIGAKPEDLCYVLYTSGTTGRPKGVMAEHRNAYRYTLAFNAALRTGPDDRVYQGFSLGFDGSVEELWMAFSNGSTLVVGSKDTPRFGDDLARFLAANGVTYFSTVPTLLTTMSESIPSLRTLVVSGEACPPEVVDRWARGHCRLYNVYGPTEATVNTTIAECRPGEPVTIGRPLPGYDLFVLDENGAPVPRGEKGELFVGGPTLARGYLKRPDLTADKFVTRSVSVGKPPRRLYRTGDLVRWNESGNLEFFGRIDGQIKIRGYRVELSEIESVLREHPSVQSAVVRLFHRDGIAQLGAFVVPASPDTAVSAEEIVLLLRRRLPDYMVPSYLDVIDTLPMLASGKVDRNQLPEPMSPLRGFGKAVVPPADPLEETILGAWKAVLGIAEISVEADFFRDLGGHSLLAAQVVTRLRDREGVVAAIRDAYKFPTIRAFAAEMKSREAVKPQVAPLARVRQASHEVFAQASRKTYALCAAAQAAGIYLLTAFGALPFAAAAIAAGLAFDGRLGWLPAIGFGIALSVVLWPALLVLGIVAKWVLVGRYRPGAYPLWGSLYFRWWLAGRFQAMSAPGLLAGTPFMSLYYRLMGARVGRGCHLDTAAVTAWDLVTIGDDTSIGADTQLLASRVEDGRLRLETVTLGRNVFVGLHSAFGLGVAMEDDSRLDDQSYLPDGAIVPAGEGRRGSPAALADVPVPAPSPRPGRSRVLALGLAQLAAGYALFLALLVPGLALLALTVATYGKFGLVAATAVQALLVPAAVCFYCVYLAVLKRLVLPRVEPGTYSLYGMLYLRKWIADGIVRSSRALLLPVYTTLFLPAWLRLMGAKIGRRAELSTVWYFSPEMLVVEPESFFADGCILGGRRTHGGSFRLERNHVGRRSFVGNGALLPVGAGLGDGCLLGVLSSPPASGCASGEFRTEAGTEWLGSPAFSLPNRPKATCFDETATYKPTKKLVAQRAVIDVLRILIPGYLGSLALFAMALGSIVIHRTLGVAATALFAPFLALAIGAISAMAVVALKWAVMGRFAPVTVPLWSPYVWLNEMVNGAYESVMAPAIAVYLGTPFVVPFLRAIGIDIGRRCYVATTLFSEFDLVTIGDYAALNAGAVIQNHLFEDRVMKSSRLTIGNDCAVGNMAVVLYDTEMQAGATLAPLSLLMKGEKLSPFTQWHGIPTVPVERGNG